MRFVAVADKHHVVHLAAHFAVGSEGGGTIHFCAHVHHRVGASGKWRADTCPFHHFGIFPDIHRTFGEVDYRTLHLCALLEEKARRAIGEISVSYYNIGVAHRLRLAPCHYAMVIEGERGVVKHKNVVVEIYTEQFFVPFGRGIAIAETSGVETRLVASIGKQHSVFHYRMAQRETRYCLDKSVIGDYMPHNKQGVGGVFWHKLAAKIFHSEMRDFGIGEDALPFLGECFNSHADVCHRTCKRERQQILTIFFIIKEDNVSHKTSNFSYGDFRPHYKGAKLIIYCNKKNKTARNHFAPFSGEK